MAKEKSSLLGQRRDQSYGQKRRLLRTQANKIKIGARIAPGVKHRGLSSWVRFCRMHGQTDRFSVYMTRLAMRRVALGFEKP
jgi:hypothetical protein